MYVYSSQGHITKEVRMIPPNCDKKFKQGNCTGRGPWASAHSLKLPAGAPFLPLWDFPLMRGPLPLKVFQGSLQGYQLALKKEDLRHHDSQPLTFRVPGSQPGPQALNRLYRLSRYWEPGASHRDSRKLGLPSLLWPQARRRCSFTGPHRP